MRLKGKTALVTGGGSGFGAGIVKKFALEGARVMIVDRDGAAARRVEKTIAKSGLHHVADVADANDVEELAKHTFAVFDTLDILVNNAGITHLPTDLEDVSEEDFDQVLKVNAKSVFLTAKNFVPHMKHNKKGVILNIASTAGVSPRPRLNWYNASKGWMITATKTMAVELAAHGVRVNAINPVAGETPLLKSFMGEDTPEMREKFLSTIPIGRFSTPDDIGSAAAFLCSDEASMITGACLEVDGGRCI